ncbi:MAG: hypothetical protein LBD45_08060, partial [Bacteroidales bacterium]|nr:hypothetical protein [Bacteroidales bacterium]
MPEKPIINTACVLSDKFLPLNFGVKLKLAFSVGCCDLLNDRKMFQAMQGREYEYYEFDTQNNTIDAMPAISVLPVVFADTVKATISESVQQADTAALNAEVERLAYLEKARERREKYSRFIRVLHVKSMDNYNLGIVTLTDEQKSALDDYIAVLEDNPR